MRWLTIIGVGLTGLATLFGVLGGFCDYFGLYCPASHETQPAITAPPPAIILSEPANGADTERAWTEAQSVDSRIGYETFVANYPISPHAITAREKIQQFLDAEHDADWRRAGSVGTALAYEDFLQRHPDSPHAIEARDAIRQIRAAETDLAWRAAAANGSAEAYRQFLRQYPDSPYESYARQAIQQREAQAQANASASMERSCQAWAETVVPRRSNPVTGGFAGCITGLLSDSQDGCQRNAQRAMEESQQQQRRDQERRDNEFQNCLRNGGPPQPR